MQAPKERQTKQDEDKGDGVNSSLWLSLAQ